MTSVHDARSSGPRVDDSGVANQRSRGDFERARRHSKIVSLLKRVLPVTAVLISITFVIIVSLSLSPLANLALELGAFRDGKLVMDAPKLSGFDSKNRPFDLVAARAMQDLTKPDVIFLENIDATVPMDAQDSVDINASAGIYETKKEVLRLSKQILIKGARGLDVTLQSADIDMNEGVLVSNQPIKIESKDSLLTASSVRVEDNGKRIVFKDKVKLTILPTTTIAPKDSQ